MLVKRKKMPCCILHQNKKSSTLTRRKNWNTHTSSSVCTFFLLLNRVADLDGVLGNEFFPQVGLGQQHYAHKAFFFAHVLVELFKRSCGITRPDSKEAFVNQRCDTNAQLVATLVRTH
jgi:hypothetical protein